MAAVLDVEDPEQRLRRLQNTLERLNDTTSVSNHTGSLSANSTKPHFIPPPNDLLSRVQAFLPALEASNALLSSQDPARIDIEHLHSDSGPYIEMNLGLGLFDVRGSTSTAALSANLPAAPVFSLSKSPSTSSESSTMTPTESSSSEDWDSDEDSDAEIITSFKPVRPIKPLPRRAIRQIQAQVRPRIVMLSERGAESDCGARNSEEG